MTYGGDGGTTGYVYTEEDNQKNSERRNAGSGDARGINGTNVRIIIILNEPAYENETPFINYGGD